MKNSFLKKNKKQFDWKCSFFSPCCLVPQLQALICMLFFCFVFKWCIFWKHFTFAAIFFSRRTGTGSSALYRFVRSRFCKKTFSLPSVLKEETQISNTREMDCVAGGRWIGEFLVCADDFYFALAVAHWRIQINVTAFNFSLFLSLSSFTLGLFNFPGPSSPWRSSILETDAP